MRKCRIILCLFVLMLMSTVYAANPTLGISNPTSGGSIKNGASINFTVGDADGPADIIAEIYYSSAHGAKENLIVNLPLNATVCPTLFDNFITPTPCTYIWNSQPADGGYYFEIKITDNTNSDGVLSTLPDKIKVDNTAPVTTAQYTNGKVPTGVALN